MTPDERLTQIEKQQDELRKRWLDFLEATHRARTDYEGRMSAQISTVTDLISAVQLVSNALTKTVDRIQKVQDVQDTMIHETQQQSERALWLLKNGGRQGVLQRQDRLEEELEQHPATCPIGKALDTHLEYHKTERLTKPQKVAIIMAAATALPGWIIGIISFVRWLVERAVHTASTIVPS